MLRLHQAVGGTAGPCIPAATTAGFSCYHNLYGRPGELAEQQTCLEVLLEFVRDIDAAGGIYRDRNNNPCPVGDPDWIDLGHSYLRACAVLRRRPKEAGELVEADPYAGIKHTIGLDEEDAGETD